MHSYRDIKFTASQTTSKLTAGKVCYQGQVIHNHTLDEAETRKAFADYARLPNSYRTSTERKTIANLEKTNFFLGFLEVGYRQNWSELSGLSHTDIGVAQAGYSASVTRISGYRERDIRLRESG